jgi:tRNA G18 (ribose-2'-O)-methylase SpoU
MSITHFDDLADPRLDPYRHLKKTNDTARRGLFIAEGDKLVRRLLESRLTVDSVLLSRAYVDAFRDLLHPDVPTFVVPDELVETLVGFNFHRGILACGKRPLPPPSVADIFASNEAPVQTLVVCPDVQDPENLGAIIRLAAGFGVSGLLLGPECADPFSRRVQRVSMGTVYQLPVVPCRNVVAALQELRDRYQVESWGAVLADDAVTLGDIARPPRLALVFGSEGHGLTGDVVAACDRKMTIPMRSGVDSFNVAVAAGIFLHEATRSV